MTAYAITHYRRQYLQPVRDLIFNTQLVHTHLDWHETDQWLETQPALMRLAWLKGQLVGLLATSGPLNHTCWLRLVVLPDQAPHQEIFSLMWQDMTQELQALSVHTVALLAVRDWITPYAAQMGFTYCENIITLARYGHSLPDIPATPFSIRVVEWEDLERVARVDQAAFGPPWQLAVDELRQAHRVAASCTMALLDGAVVGYQLSTLYFDGAHLARLAVIPDVQGQGVGAALLTDVLQRFFRRRVESMTVNTQASNQRSRHLYERFGFRPNGYNLPYWTAAL